MVGMWYKTLGFARFPLDPRSNTELVGVDHIHNQLRDIILKGNMCLLCGYTGSGKTSMLQKISQDEALKQFRFVFISADGIEKDFNVERALKQHAWFQFGLLRRKPKNLVILLDESHVAHRILTESIKSKWNVTYPDGTKAIHSVVVSQIEDRLGTNFSGSFADRLGKRIIKMPKLSGDELVAVLKSRLNNGKRNYADAFNDDAFALLVESADGSVRQMLEYADAVFTHHETTDKGNPLLDESYVISREAVFNILQTTGLVSFDRLGRHRNYQKILEKPQYATAIEMFTQFGSLCSVELAEKMDVHYDDATKIITRLVKEQALLFAHSTDGREYYVLSPRLLHEVTRA